MDQRQQAALLGRLGLTRKVCEAKRGWGGWGREGCRRLLITKALCFFIRIHPRVRGSYVCTYEGSPYGGRPPRLGSPRPQARLTLSWKAVMSHSSTSRLEPRFSAAMNCSRFSCFMPGVLKISRSLCHDCLS